MFPRTTSPQSHRTNSKNRRDCTDQRDVTEAVGVCQRAAGDLCAEGGVDWTAAGRARSVEAAAGAVHGQQPGAPTTSYRIIPLSYHIISYHRPSSRYTPRLIITSYHILQGLKFKKKKYHIISYHITSYNYFSHIIVLSYPPSSHHITSHRPPPPTPSCVGLSPLRWATSSTCSG